ncbi:MAG: ankyrin repeat domain-containing protein [Campylobacterota bacterium]|nr:ankyrin repeat domain-containing protein [Campylobacterota bacterium]
MNEIKVLLENGADVNSKDGTSFSLLMSCASKNDLDSIRALLEYNVSINSKDDRHFSALDYAIKSNSLDAIELLVHNGATITSQSYMYALKTNHKEIIDFFDSLDPNKHIFLKNKKR